MIVPGCSDSKSPTASSSATTTASPSQESTDSAASDEPSAPLDSESCVDVTGASLDLSAATSTEDARPAADALEKYNPPTAARAAIEHFASTGGAQFDDPDYSTSNDALDTWVHQVCPPA